MKNLIFCLLALCVTNIFASNVEVWTLDEQRNSSNLTVLRFKVKNTGDQNISGLELHYNITHSVSNLANPEIYYLPNGTAEWSIKDSINATLIIRFPNAILVPGAELTDAAGFAIGLHASNWGLWNKSDDYSQPLGYGFSLTNNIDVYSNGILSGQNAPEQQCPEIWFTEIQKDSLKIAWAADSDSNLVSSIQIHGFQGLLGTVDLSQSADSINYKLWQGAIPVQSADHGEIWAVCQGSIKAFAAFGAPPNNSNIAVENGLWDSKESFIIANMDLGYNQGLKEGDRLIIHNGTKGRNAFDWEYYKIWEEPDLPKLPNAIFPGFASKIMPESEDDSLTFEWTPIEGAFAYNLIILKDSVEGDTVLSIITPETSVRLPMLSPGNFIWWAEPVERNRGFWSSFTKSVKKGLSYISPVANAIFNDVNIVDAYIQYYTRPVSILTIVMPDVALHKKVLNVTSYAAKKDTRLLDLGWGKNILKNGWDISHVEDGKNKDESNQNRCWAVMAQMLNEYYDGTLTQDEIVYEIKHKGRSIENHFPHGKDLSGGPVETIDAVNFALNLNRLDIALYKDLSFFALPAAVGWSAGPLSPTDVIIALELGKPVGVSQGNKGFDGFHSSTIGGYKIMLDGSIYLKFLNTDNYGNSEWRYYASIYGLGIDVLISTILNSVSNLIGLAGSWKMGNEVYFSYFIPPFTSSGRKTDSRVARDSDNDGIMDFDEEKRFHTNPNNADTDGDGVNDKDEIIYYMLAGYAADVDKDGLRAERDPDSDNDGYCDGDEYEFDNIKKEIDSTSVHMMNAALPNTIGNIPRNCLAKPIALLAKERISINDRAYCHDGNNNYCDIVSLGEADGYSVALGVSAKSGTITAASSVWLRSRSSVNGDVHSAKTVDMQNGSSVSGNILQNSNMAMQNANLYASYFSSKENPNKNVSGNSMNILSGEYKTLSPGTYRNKITVSSGATLSLQAGEYYIDELSVLSGGALILPETGTVKLYLVGAFGWNGYFANQTIENVAGRFFIHTKYDKTMYLNASFGGQVKAPNAWVVIGQADKEYAGQIHARRITIHQNSTFLWIKEGQNAFSPTYTYLR